MKTESKLNISNLKEYVKKNGNVVKNYVLLCEILGIKNTKRKEMILRELSANVDYKKSGQSFVINKFYDKPRFYLERESVHNINYVTIFNYIFDEGKEKEIICEYYEIYEKLG